MNKISSLTKSLRSENQKPTKFTEPIKESVSIEKINKWQSIGDGRDWARQIMLNQNRHNQLAIKWAREVL
ncbi:MAG: hypothetical protein ACO24I_05440, partial [Candidatus Fonsibacter ubiquis]